MSSMEETRELKLERIKRSSKDHAWGLDLVFMIEELENRDRIINDLKLDLQERYCEGLSEDQIYDVDCVKSMLDEVERTTDDYEHAHGMQDSLFEDVVRAIANDMCPTPKLCCKEALKVLDIDFPRYGA